jgi:O-antigen ligase
LVKAGFCHNFYMNSFTETGLFGGLAVIWLFVLVLKKLISVFRNTAQEGFRRHINICLIGSWIAFLINNLFDQICFFFNRTAEMKFFWLLLAITALFIQSAPAYAAKPMTNGE